MYGIRAAGHEAFLCQLRLVQSWNKRKRVELSDHAGDTREGTKTPNYTFCLDSPLSPSVSASDWIYLQMACRIERAPYTRCAPEQLVVLTAKRNVCPLAAEWWPFFSQHRRLGVAEGHTFVTRYSHAVTPAPHWSRQSKRQSVESR
jgi:hypothetical protein